MISTEIDGIEIILETDYPSKGGVEKTSIPQMKKITDSVISNSLDVAIGFAKKLKEKINTLEEIDRPTKTNVEFGIKFNAEGQIIIAKVSTDTSIRVNFTYEK